jgi:hypothetical protein
MVNSNRPAISTSLIDQKQEALLGEKSWMPRNILKSGPFAGISANDTFALAALRESPVVYSLPTIPWPANLQPTSVPFGNYAPGTKITSAVTTKVDVLVILYTEKETMAMLDVMTGSSDWTSKTRASGASMAIISVSSKA